MARIVCFSDSIALQRAVRLGLGGHEHTVFPLPSSRLTDDLRRTVQQFAPDVVLLELSQALDSPHLFIFIRSDAATRDVPVIVVSSGAQAELYAEAFGADACLPESFGADDLRRAIAPFVPAPAPAPLPAPLPAPRRPLTPARPAELRAPAALSAAPAIVPA